MSDGDVPGSSVETMAESIAQGQLLVTERAFDELSAAELDQLTFALERRLRDLRAQQPSEDQPAALTDRNRRVQRLNAARAMLTAYRRQQRR